MGNTTAVRSFALSGGAAGSLLAAVAIVLVVLGAILAFNAADRSAPGSAEQSVAIAGAPEAAAQSVRPATREVAARPQPIPDPAASGPALIEAPPADGILVLAPEDVPPLPRFENPPDVPGPPPGPDPECVLGSVLPECVEVPEPRPPSGYLGDIAVGLDSATVGLLGLNLGLTDLTAPLGKTLDDLLAGLRPPLKGAADGLDRSVAGARTGINQTVGGARYGLNNLLSGLGGK